MQDKEETEIRRWIERLDQFCAHAAIGLIVLLILLFIFQSALQFDIFRQVFAATERLEGVPITGSAFCTLIRSVV